MVDSALLEIRGLEKSFPGVRALQGVNLTVLRNGRHVGEYLTAELPRLELAARMIGKTTAESKKMNHPPAVSDAAVGEPWLGVTGFGRKGSIQTLIAFQGNLNTWWTRIAVGVLLLLFILLQKLAGARRR